MSVRRGVRAGLCALAALFVVAVPGAGPALAASGDGFIPRYDVVMVIDPAGAVRVSETIAYTFTDDSRGIIRLIPNRYRYDDTYDRVFDIEDVRVTSPSGAPTATLIEQEGDYLRIRVGEENTFIRGPQQYVITYTVQGALNTFDDHDELYWNAIGTEWSTSIEDARARVEAPRIAEAACYTGSFGSTNLCEASSVTGAQARFRQGGLGFGRGMTVVVAVPKGLVDVAPPLLEERWSLARAFQLNPATGTLAALALGLGGGVIGWFTWQRGRDRRYVGQVPGLLPPEGFAAPVERRPLGHDAAGPVEWQPPEGMLPGQIGTLIDEKANVLDVTATIVDLAVRGYLRIEELERKNWFTSRDWKLVELKQVDGALHSYEATLLSALFRGRTEVLLSDLKQTFATDLQKVQSQLYDDLVYQGWYRRRPDTTRAFWFAAGAGAVAVAGGVTYLLARFTHFGLVGVALVIAALTLLLGARFMPARTAKGSAALARSLGFRRYLSTAEAEQLKFEEATEVFSRYLPYAIVFGETERWAKVFQQLAAGAAAAGAAGAASPHLSWYSGPSGWSFGNFNSSLKAFTTTTSGNIAATASSGGSGFGGGGFSGGGGGGGGGGGW